MIWLGVPRSEVKMWLTRYVAKDLRLHYTPGAFFFSYCDCIELAQNLGSRECDLCLSLAYAHPKTASCRSAIRICTSKRGISDSFLQMISCVTTSHL